MILHKSPWFFVNNCLFSHFSKEDFDILEIQYENLGNTNVLLTRNLENVFHAPKSLHPKYYAIIITGSKKFNSEDLTAGEALLK